MRKDDKRFKHQSYGRRDHHGNNGGGVDVPEQYLDDVPNPFAVGQREVINYMGVVELCAMAAKLRATDSL